VVLIPISLTQEASAIFLDCYVTGGTLSDDPTLLKPEGPYSLKTDF
jgi:hypothetical protein